MTSPELTFDVHTHLGADAAFYQRGWWPYAATAQDLLQHLDTHGIARACVFPFVICSAFDEEAFAQRGEIRLKPGRTPYDRENRLLVQECQRLDKQRRLHVLAMFDSNRNVPQQVENLLPLADQLDGLKVQGTVPQSAVTGLLEAGRPLMELAAARDWPVLIHTSIAESDPWSQVRDCLKVARAYPTVRFNLAHSLRFDHDSLKQVRDLPNVWVDCSAHLIHCWGATENLGFVAAPARRIPADYANPADVLAAIHDLLGDRYLWGSDNPFMSWCEDNFAGIFSYPQEVAALRRTSPAVQRDMLTVGPTQWLFGQQTVREAKHD